MTKKLHIKTWGCQMNEYDSSKMADLLDATHGYQLTDVAVFFAGFWLFSLASE